LLKISSQSNFLSKLLGSEAFTPGVEIKLNLKYKSGLHNKYVAACSYCGHELQIEIDPRS